MGIVQRCKAMSRINVACCNACWLCFDDPVAMIEKIPAIAAVGFDPAAAFVQQRMVRTAQQHEIRQRRFATVGPVLNVMTVNVATVGTTGKPAGAIAQMQCSIDCGWNRAGLATDRKRYTVSIDVGNHHTSVAA